MAGDNCFILINLFKRRETRGAGAKKWVMASFDLSNSFGIRAFNICSSKANLVLRFFQILSTASTLNHGLIHKKLNSDYHLMHGYYAMRWHSQSLKVTKESGHKLSCPFDDPEVQRFRAFGRKHPSSSKKLDRALSHLPNYHLRACRLRLRTTSCTFHE